MYRGTGASSGDPRALRIIAALFSLIGIGALIGALYQYSDVQQFLTNALRADATVVDWVEAVSSRSGDRGETSYFPIVQFVTPEGAEVRTQADIGYQPMQYYVGDRVAILYDPRDLSLVKMDTVISRWFSVLIPITLAVCFIPAGLFLWGKSRDD